MLPQGTVCYWQLSHITLLKQQLYHKTPMSFLAIFYFQQASVWGWQGMKECQSNLTKISNLGHVFGNWNKNYFKHDQLWNKSPEPQVKDSLVNFSGEHTSCSLLCVFLCNSASPVVKFRVSGCVSSLRRLQAPSRLGQTKIGCLPGFNEEVLFFSSIRNQIDGRLQINLILVRELFVKKIINLIMLLLQNVKLNKLLHT